MDGWLSTHAFLREPYRVPDESAAIIHPRSEDERTPGTGKRLEIAIATVNSKSKTPACDSLNAVDYPPSQVICFLLSVTR